MLTARALVARLTRGWRSFVSVISLGVIFGGGLVLLTEPNYRAETLLLPADVDVAATPLSQYSQPYGSGAPLSLLSGIIGGGGFKEEAIATLTSRYVTERFIDEHDLVPVLVPPSQAPLSLIRDRQSPTVHDAFEVFDKIRTVTQDRRTGLVTLSIKWSDAEQSALWTNALVARVNDLLRSRAIHQAENNLAYLRKELAATSLVELHKAIFNIMEQELNKTMIARGTAEYAFRVLDPAIVPTREARPTRKQIAVLGLFALIAFYLFIEVVRASSES
jgi:uncharacterized protein involved in exopolysaccharide biosynthesis